MIRAANKPKAGDALARRHIAQWRRVTARLVVLMNDLAPAKPDTVYALVDDCPGWAVCC